MSNQYRVYLTRFAKAIGKPQTECLKERADRDRLFRDIMSMNVKPETKKTYVNALKQLSLEQGMPKTTVPREVYTRDKDGYIEIHEDGFEPDECQKMTLEITRLAAMSKKNEHHNELDPEEDKHWRTWESVLVLYDRLNTQVNQASEFHYRMHQQRLLLALYVLHPPLRLNYGCVTMFPKSVQDDDCYVFVKDEAWWIHIGRDKISRAHGSFEFKLHADIQTFYELKNRHRPSPYLLSSVRDPLVPLAGKAGFRDSVKNEYSLLLGSIPDEKGNPSRLTCFVLRSARVTWFYRTNPSQAELMELARLMRTSVDYFETYYRKVYHANQEKIYQ